MTADPSKFYLETSEGVIIEGMNSEQFRAWMYPPSRDNWWAWGSVFFVLLLAFMLSAAYLMPIRSDAAPVTVPQATATPGKTSVGPNLRPTERKKDGF